MSKSSSSFKQTLVALQRKAFQNTSYGPKIAISLRSQRIASHNDPSEFYILIHESEISTTQTSSDVTILSHTFPVLSLASEACRVASSFLVLAFGEEHSIGYA